MDRGDKMLLAAATAAHLPMHISVHWPSVSGMLRHVSDAAAAAKSSRECLLVGRNANQATSRHYAHIFDAPPIPAAPPDNNNINNNTRQINSHHTSAALTIKLDLRLHIFTTCIWPGFLSLPRIPI